MLLSLVMVSMLGRSSVCGVDVDVDVNVDLGLEAVVAVSLDAVVAASVVVAMIVYTGV